MRIGRHLDRDDRHLPAAARVRRRAGALRPGRRVHVAGLALDAARAHARPRAGPAVLVARRRARAPASSRSAWPSRPAGRPRWRARAGTAAAHYLPAVIEAHEARVPLIVLTADRPPELRDVGAGQTIDQLKLYGDAGEVVLRGRHARARRPSGCAGSASSPSAPTGPRCRRAPRRRAPQLPAARAARARRGRCRAGRRRAPSRRARRAAPAAPRSSLERRPSARLIVAGRHERDAGLAAALPPPRAAAWRAAAGRPALGRAARPRGRRPLRRAAARRGLRRRPPPRHRHPRRRPADVQAAAPVAGRRSTRAQVAFDPEGAWQDPAAVVAEVPRRRPRRAGRARSPAPPRAERVARRLARRRRRAPPTRSPPTLGDELSEPRVARALGRALPERRHRLHRLLDAGARRRELLAGARRAAARARQPRRQRHRRHARRGLRRRRRAAAASSSTSATSPSPTTSARLLTAVAPDAARSRSSSSTTPAAGSSTSSRSPRRRDAFEEHVATPTGLDAERVAALFGLRLRAASRRSAPSARPPGTLLHVRTDRAENVALHRRVHEAVAVRLGR